MRFTLVSCQQNAKARLLFRTRFLEHRDLSIVLNVQLISVDYSDLCEFHGLYYQVRSHVWPVKKTA